MASLFKAVAEFAPALTADAPQVACGWRVMSGGGGRDEPHFAAQHGRRRGRLASRGAPLVVALGAEQLLKIVVGPGQARHGAAVEQPGPVAAGNLGKVLDGGDECASPVAMAQHGTEQPIEPAP